MILVGEKAEEEQQKKRKNGEKKMEEDETRMERLKQKPSVRLRMEEGGARRNVAASDLE